MADRTATDACRNPIAGDVCACPHPAQPHSAHMVVSYLALGRTANGDVDVRCTCMDGSTLDIQVPIKLWSSTAGGWVHTPAHAVEAPQRQNPAQASRRDPVTHPKRGDVLLRLPPGNPSQSWVAYLVESVDLGSVHLSTGAAREVWPRQAWATAATQGIVTVRP